MIRAKIYLALLHYPMLNRHHEIVTTAVTNLDLHDIARSARTYEVTRTFFVTPVQEQHELLKRILGHWGAKPNEAYHPDRVEALDRIRLCYTFEEAKKAILEETSENPEVVFTDAREQPNALSYEDYHTCLSEPARSRPVLLVFGTGWGIAPAFFKEADLLLKPVFGPLREGGYNHLSVRAAVAIILDRLFGQ